MMELSFSAQKNKGLSVTAAVGGLGAQGAFALYDNSTAPPTDLGAPASLGSSSARWDFDWATVQKNGWDSSIAILHLQAVLTSPNGSNLTVYITVGQPNGGGAVAVPAADISTSPPTIKSVPVLVGNGTVPGVVVPIFAINFN